ncbi:hypothetical protein [Paenibacillus sp. ISL-20]|uniref:hypothetical protein n=1 Tax=Paenibacillus sp. ISL-20 TaxID=2819163 RepID=UPI001BE519EC|nr:hypothetical protein [Paenibacillus sp. ISL-20]MBT2760105.1 hypothetical protein [Paenibacillus sp. ISL-20]
MSKEHCAYVRATYITAHCLTTYNFSGLSGPYFDQKHHFLNTNGPEIRYSPNEAIILPIIGNITDRVSDKPVKASQ